MNIKITINSENRIVVIPMSYENDNLSFSEVQVEPELKSNEDISNDIVLHITTLILNTFKNLKN